MTVQWLSQKGSGVYKIPCLDSNITISQYMIGVGIKDGLEWDLDGASIDDRGNINIPHSKRHLIHEKIEVWVQIIIPHTKDAVHAWMKDGVEWDRSGSDSCNE